jgi:membrane protein insertase Oxa1/YidC/SpoIIIJ
MVFFLWMPSGLVLYWLVSNVWTIGQQIVTNRLIGASSKKVVGTTAATKRVKRAEDV